MSQASKTPLLDQVRKPEDLRALPEEADEQLRTAVRRAGTAPGAGTGS